MLLTWLVEFLRLLLIPDLLGNETILNYLLDTLFLTPILKTATNSKTIRVTLIEELELHLRNMLSDTPKHLIRVGLPSFVGITCLHS